MDDRPTFSNSLRNLNEAPYNLYEPRKGKETYLFYSEHFQPSLLQLSAHQGLRTVPMVLLIYQQLPEEAIQLKVKLLGLMMAVSKNGEISLFISGMHRG